MTPDDQVWTERDKTPFPEWVTEFRPHQTQAVEEIIDHFDSGTKVVFLDAPTGAGKTLIGEMVRRQVATKSLYVCHSLGLQDQFVRDFPYAKVLKGRANYPTCVVLNAHRVPDLTNARTRWQRNRQSVPGWLWSTRPTPWLN